MEKYINEKEHAEIGKITDQYIHEFEDEPIWKAMKALEDSDLPLKYKLAVMFLMGDRFDSAYEIVIPTIISTQN